MKQLKRSCIRQQLDVARHTRCPWPRLLSNCPSPQPSLIRVSASGRSFDRTISELVSGSSWIAHRARGPPGPDCCGRAFLLRRSPEPCTGANRPATPPSYSYLLTQSATPPPYSYWYKVLHHPHIHSTLLCYTTLIFILTDTKCYTTPTYIVLKCNVALQHYAT